MPKQQRKQKQKINMLTPTGIITPVRVNELIPRECFCILYAQRVNLFGIRVVLCLLPATCYLRLISRCVTFFVSTSFHYPILAMGTAL
jgi:hypothetical protein